MLDVEVIDDPAAAMAALDPVRGDVLSDPRQARLIDDRCRHARSAAPAGQLPPAHSRTSQPRSRRRGASEAGPHRTSDGRQRRGRTSCRSQPSVRNAADPARTDRLSTRYLIAVAARMVGEVADLARACRRGRQAARDAGDRQRDPIRVGRRPSCVHRRARQRRHRARCEVPRRDGRPRALAPCRCRCTSRFPLPLHSTRRTLTMDDENRSIELEVEVVGTPEEVWQAIATGPGISSWYVPHTVEEREGGAATARFGPGPEMLIPGRVAAWEPPRRIVFDGGEGVGGMRLRVAGRSSRRWHVRRSSRQHRLRIGRRLGRSIRRHDGGMAAVPAQPQAAPRSLPWADCDCGAPHCHVGRSAGGSVGRTDRSTRRPSSACCR